MQTPRAGLLWLLACSALLASCDVDLFGLDAKRIAAGWKLVQTERGFVLNPPHKNGGGYVDRIGWRKPFIISGGESSSSWDVIDTSAGTQSSITDEQRRTDQLYRHIPIRHADDAWTQLKHWRRQW
jgi:hypothetical protein